MERLASIVYVCAFCGYEHDREYVQLWGIDGRGDGLGPKPVCDQLVEGRPAGSMQSCGGDLVAIAVEPNQPGLQEES